MLYTASCQEKYKYNLWCIYAHYFQFYITQVKKKSVIRLLEHV